MKQTSESSRTNVKIEKKSTSTREKLSCDSRTAGCFYEQLLSMGMSS